MNDEHIKGQAVSAISAFNTRQRSTLDMIDIAPWSMRVLDENTVVQDTIRERVMVSRQNGSVFQVVGRQLKQ